MGIDFYQKNTLILSIPESIFIRLDDSNIHLEKSTGKFVDPYGNTQLSKSERQLWLKGLRECKTSLTEDARALDACQKIIDLLSKVAEEDVLVVVGE